MLLCHDQLNWPQAQVLNSGPHYKAYSSSSLDCWSSLELELELVFVVNVYLYKGQGDKHCKEHIALAY